MKKLLALMLVLCLIVPISSALASDVFDALYIGTIRVTNNSTAATDVSVPFTASSADYIAGGFMNSSANNTAIQQSTGVDVHYMPGYGDSNPWMIFVPAIGANTILSDTLYMGGDTDMASEIHYFPNDGGMTTVDSATLELGDNFTIEQAGWFDTDNSTDKNLVYKANTFRTIVSPTVSENITSSIYQTEISPVGSAPSGIWANIPNSYDDNTGTYATCVVGGVGYSNTLFLLLSENTTTDSLRFWANDAAGDVDEAIIQVYDGAWTEVHNGVFDKNQWYTVTFDERVIGRVSLQFHVTQAETARCHEVDVAGYHCFVSALDVASGEHIVTSMANGSFFGLGIDLATDTTLPAGDSLALGLPLHHTDLATTTFASKDSTAHTITVTDATWGNTGRHFDGTGDYINCGTSPVLDVANMTMQAWVYLDTAAPASNGYVFNSAGAALMYQRAGTKELPVEVEVASGRAQVTIPAGSISIATWYNMALTWDGSTLTGYLDANSVDTDVTESGVMDASTAFYVGAGTAGGFVLTGTVGEFWYYDRAFTPDEVTDFYNATKWRYDGSISGNTDTHLPYRYLDGVSVLDTSDNWTFVSNNSTPYLTSQNITIDGVSQQYIAWEYSDIFTDASGNSHDATPTFRTTSTDPDVSAALLTFGPVEEARAPAYSINITTEGWITGSITQTGNFTAATTNTTYPGSDVIAAVTTAGGVPVHLLEIILAGVIVLSLSLFISWMLRTNREGSLVAKILIITAGLGIMVAVSIVDSWMLYLFLMISVALAMMASSRQFTGTGNAGNNMIGFLVFSFVGMTMINRILEGRVLQDSDTGVIRQVLAFQPFEVFGVFTIPVPNTGFLTEGLPALMMWDYSFFGGNAQIFQYLLYSITAVVSFILLVLVFGAVAQMFTRAR